MFGLNDGAGVQQQLRALDMSELGGQHQRRAFVLHTHTRTNYEAITTRISMEIDNKLFEEIMTTTLSIEFHKPSNKQKSNLQTKNKSAARSRKGKS